MLPSASTRRYLIADASTMPASQPLSLVASSVAGSSDPADMSTLGLPASLLPSARLSSASDSAGRTRFCPIPNLHGAFQRALAAIAARQPIAQALVEQRKRDRRAAPVVILDAHRAVCELPLGPEMFEELDRAVLASLVPPSPAVASQPRPPTPPLSVTPLTERPSATA
jgi:hypothetical protein